MVLISKYRLEIIVFIVGAAVLILEITAARVLAPYLGTSIVVWTSLIGIVLGSLSVGYWYGGKIADRTPTYKKLASIIFGGAVFCALIAFIKEPFLLLIQSQIADIRIGSVIASLVLFSPTSTVLGMVSPYAVKLRIKTLKKTGSTVGNLYAISTVGSILGAFLTGFWLIVHLGNTRILLFISIILLLTSALASLESLNKLKIAVIFFLAVSIYGSFIFDDHMRKKGFIDTDTQYNRVLVYDTIDLKTRKPIKALLTDAFAIQSAIFLDSEELVLDYTKFYRLAKHFNHEIKKSLAIGGAAYSYPKDYLKQFPQANLDVVEIDPGLTKLAKEQFGLIESARLSIYHEDGRTFINKKQFKYDAIFIDVFNSSVSVPYQLTTIEVARSLYDSLSNNGVVITNVISSIKGEKGKFLRAEYATYRAVFPQVFVLPVKKLDENLAQNIIIVALKTEGVPNLQSEDPELATYLDHLWTKKIPQDVPILTDDYAPVDQYIVHLLN